MVMMSADKGGAITCAAGQSRTLRPALDRIFDELGDNGRPIKSLQDSLNQMEDTLRALESVREQLKVLISEKYPMGHLS